MVCISENKRPTEGFSNRVEILEVIKLRFICLIHIHLRIEKTTEKLQTIVDLALFIEVECFHKLKMDSRNSYYVLKMANLCCLARFVQTAKDFHLK